MNSSHWMKYNIHLIILSIISICLVSWLGMSCQEDNPVPKPRIYPKMVLPEATMSTYQLDHCPYTFQFLDAADIEQKTEFMGEDPPNECWFDLRITSLNAVLYLSYYPIKHEKSFDQLIQDNYRIITEINKRSDYTEEVKVHNLHGVGGMEYLFEGPAASPIHFYLSDTTNHFIKSGALL